jgi:hypothetical protein
LWIVFFCLLSISPEGTATIVNIYSIPMQFTMYAALGCIEWIEWVKCNSTFEFTVQLTQNQNDLTCARIECFFFLLLQALCFLFFFFCRVILFFTISHHIENCISSLLKNGKQQLWTNTMSTTILSMDVTYNRCEGFFFMFVKQVLWNEGERTFQRATNKRRECWQCLQLRVQSFM